METFPHETITLPPPYFHAGRAMHFTHSPQEVVLDRYTIQRGVGMGGFGEVYFAISQAGKEVALKRIQRNLEVELRGVSHCLNLKSQHLVSLHDICRDDDDQAWVVMEFVDGPNLREVLDDAIENVNTTTLRSGLTEAEAIRWFTGAAAGIDHLHTAGLVHRDIKPGNLFDDNGIIKVGDYGLSKFISTSHRGGHTESVGTFHYMAPEIGRGQYGREIDLYAMGVVLFELLTGRTPFDGETPQEIIVKHLTDLPDLSDVPPRYRDVIGRCLEKDPLRRPADVQEMLRLAGLELSSSDKPFVANFVADTLGAPTPSTPAGLGQPGLDRPEPARSPASAQHAGAATAGGPIPVGGGPATITLNSSASEEPIARAIRNSWFDLTRWWRSLERSPGSKFIIVLAAVFILMVNTGWLIPVLSLVGIFYVPYYIIRHMVLQISEPATYTQANRLAAVADAGRRQAVPKPALTPVQLKQALRHSLATRTKLTRSAEWATSGMTSMAVAGILLLITSVVGLRNSEVTAITLAPYGWMISVVWLSSFGLLSLGKWWESSESEGVPRRFASAALGAGLGVAAFGLAQFLMIPLDGGLVRDIEATRLPASFYQETGMPKAAAMMAHFALLFALLRMWKPVDPLRRVRLSVWAVAVAVVGEWIIHQIVPIPQPAGMLIAGGIVTMTQVAAPWVNAQTTDPGSLRSPHLNAGDQA